MLCDRDRSGILFTKRHSVEPGCQQLLSLTYSTGNKYNNLVAINKLADIA